MTSQRWLGGLIAILAMFVATLLPTLAQEKKDDKKPDDKQEVKQEPKKPEDKKPEEKKPEEKKPEEKKPEEKTTPPASAPGMVWSAFNEGKAPFYQTLVTETKQVMNVQGQEVAQTQNQTFTIKWTPQKADDKKNLVVDQEIVGVKMNIDIGGNKIAYDSTDAKQPQNPMSDFFKQLQTLKLTLVIDPKTLDVVDVKGRDEFVAKLGATNPQMKSLLDNILNDKAIKRMAEPTWGAIPSKEVKKGESWTKTSVLELGAIGTYTTKMTYTFDGQEKGKDKISVKADLSYKVNEPGKDAPLPFKILANETSLKSEEGSGTVIYDPAKGRIESSNLKLKLKGKLNIDVAGMQTLVDLTQEQVSSSTIGDANPIAPAETKKEDSKEKK